MSIEVLRGSENGAQEFLCHICGEWVPVVTVPSGRRIQWHGPDHGPRCEVSGMAASKAIHQALTAHRERHGLTGMK